MNEDVGHLKVSVHYSPLSQVQQPFENVPDVHPSRGLIQPFVFLEDRLQVASITKLSYYITIILTFYHFIAFQNVRVMQTLNHLDLREKQLLEFRGLY